MAINIISVVISLREEILENIFFIIITKLLNQTQNNNKMNK